MIKIREIINELTELPRPNRRRAEELIRLVYKQGKEDQIREVQRLNKYKTLFNEYKKIVLYNKELELLVSPSRRRYIKPLK